MRFARLRVSDPMIKQERDWRSVHGLSNDDLSGLLAGIVRRRHGCSSNSSCGATGRAGSCGHIAIGKAPCWRCRKPGAGKSPPPPERTQASRRIQSLSIGDDGAEPNRNPVVSRVRAARTGIRWEAARPRRGRGSSSGSGTATMSSSSSPAKAAKGILSSEGSRTGAART